MNKKSLNSILITSLLLISITLHSAELACRMGLDLLQRLPTKAANSKEYLEAFRASFKKKLTPGEQEYAQLKQVAAALKTVIPVDPLQEIIVDYLGDEFGDGFGYLKTIKIPRSFIRRQKQIISIKFINDEQLRVILTGRATWGLEEGNQCTDGYGPNPTSTTFAIPDGEILNSGRDHQEEGYCEEFSGWYDGQQRNRTDYIHYFMVDPIYIHAHHYVAQSLVNKSAKSPNGKYLATVEYDERRNDHRRKFGFLSPVAGINWRLSGRYEFKPDMHRTDIHLYEKNYHIQKFKAILNPKKSFILTQQY
jgi:hypothetical protein